MSNAKKRILLVEDEVLIAAGELANLREYGYDVFHAVHGEQAIELVNKGNPPVDLVLMDVNLGKGIDGPETARRILEVHDVPIIFLSSHTSRDVVEKTELISSYGYVVKSSSITVLDASIKMAFRLFKARRKIQRDALVLASRQHALTVSEKRYRRLFESAKDGIMIVNAETGLIDDVNPYLVEMLGFSRAQLVKKNLWDINAFQDKEYSKALFRELQTNDYIRFEDLPLETATGGLVNVEFVSNVYLVDGRRVIQCNIRNINKRKHSELVSRNSIKAGAALLTESERYADVLLRTVLRLAQTRLAATANHETEDVLQALAIRTEIIVSLHSLHCQQAAAEHVDLQAYCRRQLSQLSGVPSHMELRYAMESRNVTAYVASVVSLILGEVLSYVIGNTPNLTQPDFVTFGLTQSGTRSAITIAYRGAVSTETFEKICLKHVGMHFAQLLADLLNGVMSISTERESTIHIECDLF